MGSKNYYENISAEDIDNGDNTFVSKTTDKNGMVVVGLHLPFGNAEYAIIDSKEAIELIKKLERVTSSPIMAELHGARPVEVEPGETVAQAFVRVAQGG